MSKELIGDACAHMVGDPGTKPKYIRIGNAYRDTEFNSISVKIDTLPLATGHGVQWTGWINIFDRNDAKKSGLPSKPRYQGDDDDIPF